MRSKNWGKKSLPDLPTCFQRSCWFQPVTGHHISQLRDPWNPSKTRSWSTSLWNMAIFIIFNRWCHLWKPPLTSGIFQLAMFDDTRWYGSSWCHGHRMVMFSSSLFKRLPEGTSLLWLWHISISVWLLNIDESRRKSQRWCSIRMSSPEDKFHLYLSRWITIVGHSSLLSIVNGF